MGWLGRVQDGAGDHDEVPVQRLDGGQRCRRTGSGADALHLARVRRPPECELIGPSQPDPGGGPPTASASDGLVACIGTSAVPAVAAPTIASSRRRGSGERWPGDWLGTVRTLTRPSQAQSTSPWCPVGGASPATALNTVRQGGSFPRIRLITPPTTRRRTTISSIHTSKPFMATSTTSWSAMIDTRSSRSTQPGVQASVLRPRLHRRSGSRLIRAG